VGDACRRGAARFALRWPKARSTLNQVLATNVHVQELCEAYEAACAAVEYWLHADSPDGFARADEYRALAASTEQDILDALNC